MDVEKQTDALDWDDARFFLAALRVGSLIGAAQSLGVSHSTVKRRLQGLERTLGVKLFTATSEGLAPTDAALTARDIAEHLEETIGQFSDRLVGASRELTGTLVVTAADGMTGMLARAIKTYTNRFPNVALTLRNDNRVLDLRRREADVAVRITNEPEDHLFGRKVGVCDFQPFASQQLVDRCGDAYSELPWVLWDPSAGATGIEQWFHDNVPDQTPVIRVAHTTAMLSLVDEGVGAAVLPVPCAMAAGLTPIGDVIDGFGTDIWCLCHQDLRLSERVRGFLEDVAEGFSIYTAGR